MNKDNEKILAQLPLIEPYTGQELFYIGQVWKILREIDFDSFDETAIKKLISENITECVTESRVNELIEYALDNFECGGGDRNIDGGRADEVYLPSQKVDGGNANG